MLQFVAAFCNVLSSVTLLSFASTFPHSRRSRVLQGVAMCCVMLQRFAMCCSVSLCSVSPLHPPSPDASGCCRVLHLVADLCSILQCVTLLSFASTSSISQRSWVLLRIAVCCSVFQCVVVHHSLQFLQHILHLPTLLYL